MLFKGLDISCNIYIAKFMFCPNLVYVATIWLETCWKKSGLDRHMLKKVVTFYKFVQYHHQFEVKYENFMLCRTSKRADSNFSSNIYHLCVSQYPGALTFHHHSVSVQCTHTLFCSPCRFSRVDKLLFSRSSPGLQRMGER